ncbi:hypothetical protein DFH09DRAFT_1087106 [Mycena vulgaris]|nr:hypothetical protein DFH09DRAFT_1087106 [Mycena vulgaris]
MQFPAFVNILAVALFFLIAVPHVHASPISPAGIPPDDHQCPKGFSTTFLHNNYTTTGTDDVPGATRAGVFGAAAFNETLTAYSAGSDGLSYTIQGNRPLTIAQGNHQRPLHVASYAETKRFASVCGGKATFIDFSTYLCTDNQTVGYNSFYNVHMTTMKKLASTIRAPALAGDCCGA